MFHRKFNFTSIKANHFNFYLIAFFDNIGYFSNSFICKFLGKQDGLVHISELANKRVAKVGDIVKEGDEVSVKVVGFDRGKVKLSMKQASA